MTKIPNLSTSFFSRERGREIEEIERKKKREAKESGKKREGKRGEREREKLFFPPIS